MQVAGLLPTNWNEVLFLFNMGKGRLEAFSDGVMAIIITIMVLEIRVPHGDSPASLRPLAFTFISYILSFINVGIYWNNHHHMMHAVNRVSGTTLWANIHLLFWLSLIPFSSGWIGENHFGMWPMVLYGVILEMAGIAYYILAHTLIKLKENTKLALAFGKDRKGIISVIIYPLGIALCFINPWLGFSMYVLVAAIWVTPDKRIEEDYSNKGNPGAD